MAFGATAAVENGAACAFGSGSSRVSNINTIWNAMALHSLHSRHISVNFVQCLLCVLCDMLRRRQYSEHALDVDHLFHTFCSSQASMPLSLPPFPPHLFHPHHCSLEALLEHLSPSLTFQSLLLHARSFMKSLTCQVLFDLVDRTRNSQIPQRTPEIHSFFGNHLDRTSN